MPWRNAWLWELEGKLGEELRDITRSQGPSSGNTCLQSLSRITKATERVLRFLATLTTHVQLWVFRAIPVPQQ